MLRLLQLQIGQLTDMAYRVQRLGAEDNQRNEAMRNQKAEAQGQQPHGSFNHQLAVGDRMEMEYGELRVEPSVCSYLNLETATELMRVSVIQCIFDTGSHIILGILTLSALKYIRGWRFSQK